MSSRLSARNYPRKSEIQRLVLATRESGVVVRAVEFQADGTIRLLPNAPASDSKPDLDEFEAWERDGRL